MSYNVASQPRRPAGAPDGGEYTSAAAPEALFDPRELPDDEYNADGTFEFPPRPRSAAQVLAFWAGVKVPDTILMNVRMTYAEREQRQWDAQRHDLEQRYRTDRAFAHDGDTFDGGREAHLDAVMADLWQERLREIPMDDVRSAVRASQALEQAQRLDDAERAKVAHHEVYLNVVGRLSTVEKVELGFGLAELREQGAFTDPTRFVGNQLVAITDELEESIQRARTPITDQEFADMEAAAELNAHRQAEKSGLAD